MAEPTFKTEPAVIVECSICGKRSKPCDPKPSTDPLASTQAKFEEQHRQLHDTERIIGLANDAGHKITLECTRMEPDSVQYRAVCECGWSGRSLPTWQAEKEARNHQVEALDLKDD